MKLDLNFVLTSLKGEPAQGIFDNTHAGAIVGSVLSLTPRQHSELSYMRRHIIGTDLYKQIPVEVTAGELKQIKEIIQWPESGLSPLIIVQVIEAIDKIKEL